MKKITLFLLCSLFVLVNCSKIKENCEYKPEFEKSSEKMSESLDGIAQIENLQHKTALTVIIYLSMFYFFLK